LVLADTVAGISDPAIAAHHASMIERARRIAAAPPPLGVHPALDGEFSAREPDRAYLYQALASFGAPSAGEIAEQLAAATFDQASLATNRVPALFIVGERDPVFPVTIVERAAAELARSRVIVMPGAGHSPYFEQPRAWNRIVTRFFEESPEHPGRAARR
jgi:2-succinyl-6-hydroxy-2,4-cyclohexadiene-1-carboxylate synthase